MFMGNLVTASNEGAKQGLSLRPRKISVITLRLKAHYLLHLQKDINLILSPARSFSITYKQLDRAPLRYRSAEHGPACLARSARSQTIGRFAPS